VREGDNWEDHVAVSLLWGAMPSWDGGKNRGEYLGESRLLSLWEILKHKKKKGKKGGGET